jgi:hypothetical protein
MILSCVEEEIEDEDPCLIHPRLEQVAMMTHLSAIEEETGEETREESEGIRQSLILVVIAVVVAAVVVAVMKMSVWNGTTLQELE